MALMASSPHLDISQAKSQATELQSITWMSSPHSSTLMLTIQSYTRRPPMDGITAMATATAATVATATAAIFTAVTAATTAAAATAATATATAATASRLEQSA